VETLKQTPDQEGVMHGPHTPSEGIGLGFGYDEHVHQLQEKKTAVNEARNSGLITEEGSKVLGASINKALGDIYAAEDAAMRGQEPGINAGHPSINLEPQPAEAHPESVSANHG
jgi:hypothetical protein